MNLNGSKTNMSSLSWPYFFVTLVIEVWVVSYRLFYVGYLYNPVVQYIILALALLISLIPDRSESVLIATIKGLSILFLLSLVAFGDSSILCLILMTSPLWCLVAIIIPILIDDFIYRKRKAIFHS